MVELVETTRAIRALWSRCECCQQDAGYGQVDGGPGARPSNRGRNRDEAHGVSATASRPGVLGETHRSPTIPDYAHPVNDYGKPSESMISRARLAVRHPNRRSEIIENCLVDKRILGPFVSVVGSRFLPMTSTAEVFDLDVREALVAAAAERRQADRSEARLLALAIQVVHLHPVDDDTPVACWRDPLLMVPDDGDPITGSPRRSRHPAGRRACGRGARRRPRHLLRLRLRPGRGSARAALPPPPAVGTRPGRVAAGMEGPQDRRADHHLGPEAVGVRRPAGRDRRREEPDRAQPHRPDPPGADQVRTRQRPRAGRSRQEPPRRGLRLPRRRHPRLRHHVRHLGLARRPRPRRHRQ